MSYKIGIDVGSTTVKVVLRDSLDKLVYKRYMRHNTKIIEILVDIMNDLYSSYKDISAHVAITGSAGLGIADRANLPFVQEVISSTTAVEHLIPATDTVIELGGEDAKIIFIKPTLEQRMNGTCAGGTGAFIDQMATLMNVTVDELNELAANHGKIYPIASRCGVFAKSDIQPLLNQGAKREDVAASIMQAVVNQTIAGLAQGRPIKGNVAFLGGPLAFLSELRKSFAKTLNLDEKSAVFPLDAEYFVAIGCSIESESFEKVLLSNIINRLEGAEEINTIRRGLPVLFNDKEEYEAFKLRHSQNTVEISDISTYKGVAYLGIDAGSTTTKLVLLSEDNKILFSYYAPNLGNPVLVLKDQLTKLYSLLNDSITINGSCVTGYGEDLIKSAFGVDHGVVETIAHFTSASYFCPNVDYIIDIGGQDMKCFKVHNSSIDSIMLNEACSSGCGSFIETFAKAIGYSTVDFANVGLFSKSPSDLGSRCTVFMNSAVKQAQKEGATTADISAGLSISVVKNALYKVIRVVDPSELGKNVVVQGGTFLNDAILRAFEQELATEVTRPAIAGLMGAFGCALYAKEHTNNISSIIDERGLLDFSHETRSMNCGLCENRCALTVNTFANGNKYITGNRCEKGAGLKEESINIPNIFKYKYEKLRSQRTISEGTRGTIGIPFVLNVFDTLPFWTEFFNKLGIKTVISADSSHDLYYDGQDTIPSDTACYPAKLVHGHIKDLLTKGVKHIFYPVSPYNSIEYENADNFYNCPVVAYYPELIKANMPQLDSVDFINPYVVLHKPSFERNMYNALSPIFKGLSISLIRKAKKAAFETDKKFRDEIFEYGSKALTYAKANKLTTIVLAGRPYHIDPEIGHNIDKLITSLGLVVISEESISPLAKSGKLKVLNQWTYHTRMYNAARYVADNEDIELVQLVSFGCGIDAITGDEIRTMLEENGKFYTQIKIDEITNLGAAKIRLRSLISAIDARKRR